jgi:hypothetical protein
MRLIMTGTRRYVAPPNSAAPRLTFRCLNHPYVKRPARNTWSTIFHPIARWTGMKNFSTVVG